MAMNDRITVTGYDIFAAPSRAVLFTGSSRGFRTVVTLPADVTLE